MSSPKPDLSNSQQRDKDKDDSSSSSDEDDSSSSVIATQRGHHFKRAYFKTLTWCALCRCLISGVFHKQGHRCKLCKMAIHTDCIEKVEESCSRVYATPSSTASPSQLTASSSSSLSEYSPESSSEQMISATTIIDPKSTLGRSKPRLTNLLQAAQGQLKANLEKGLTSMGQVGQKIATMTGLSVRHRSEKESNELWDSAFKGENAVAWDRFCAALSELVDVNLSHLVVFRTFLMDPAKESQVTLSAWVDAMKYLGPLPSLPLNLHRFAQLPFYPLAIASEAHSLLAHQHPPGAFLVRSELAPLRLYLCWVEDSAGKVREVSLTNPAVNQLEGGGIPPYDAQLSPAVALDKNPSQFSLQWILEHSCGLWRTPAKVDALDFRWYHGAISDLDAIKLLQLQQTAFLLRFGTSNKLVLTLKESGNVRNLEIAMVSSKAFGDTTANRNFSTILELIASRNISLAHSVNRVGKEELLRAKAEIAQLKPIENAGLDTYRIFKRWTMDSAATKHRRFVLLGSNPETLHDFCRTFTSIQAPIAAGNAGLDACALGLLGSPVTLPRGRQPFVDSSSSGSSTPTTSAGSTTSQADSRVSPQHQREGSIIIPSLPPAFSTGVGVVASPSPALPQVAQIGSPGRNNSPMPGVGAAPPSPLSSASGTASPVAKVSPNTSQPNVLIGSTPSIASSTSSVGSAGPAPLPSSSPAPPHLSSATAIGTSSTALFSQGSSMVFSMRTIQSRGSNTGSPVGSAVPIPAITTTPLPMLIDDAKFELDSSVITDVACAAARLAAYQVELQKLSARATSPSASTSSSTIETTAELHIMRYLFAVKLSLWELARQVKADTVNWERVNDSACDLYQACADVLVNMQHRLRALAPQALALISAAHSILHNVMQLQRSLNANPIDAPGSMFLQYLKSLRASFELFGLRGRSGAVDGWGKFQEAMDSWTKLRVSIRYAREELNQLQTSVNEGKKTEVAAHLEKCVSRMKEIANARGRFPDSVKRCLPIPEGEEALKRFSTSSSSSSSSSNSSSSSSKNIGSNSPNSSPSSSASVDGRRSSKRRDEGRKMVLTMLQFLSSFDLLELCILAQQRNVSYVGSAYVDCLYSTEEVRCELIDTSQVPDCFRQNFFLPNCDAVIFEVPRGVTAGKMGDIFEQRARGIRPGASVAWFEALELRDVLERGLGDEPVIDTHPPAGDNQDVNDPVLQIYSFMPQFSTTTNVILGELALQLDQTLKDRLFLKPFAIEKAKGKLQLHLTKLTCLERLNYARFGFESLHTLSLEDNGIAAIPRFLCLDMAGKEIRYLHLDGNKLNEFPLELSALGLMKLSLSNNLLDRIPPEIKCFTTLEELDLSSNHLNYLPAELGDLSLKHITITGNPLETIPQEVVRCGTKSILSFLRNLKSPTVKWKRLKLVFVGEENVGKTSLLNCFNPKKPHIVKKTTASGATVNDTISTNGVDIDEISLDKDVEFSAWDFGGQEVFYPTHQFFLSDRAMYLLCFNLERPNANRIEYWLKQIRLQRKQAGASPPVFLVGTHADAVSKEISQAIFERFENQFKSAHNIRASVAVSCTAKTGVKELSQILKQDALKQKLLNELIPGSWQNLANFIAKEKVKTRTPVRWEAFQQMARECGVLEEDIPACTQFLHDVGMLVHFSSPHMRMRDLVVLDPQFLSTVFASVVTFKHRLVKSGILYHSDLPQIWSFCSADMHDSLLQLLENFEIAYRIKNAEKPQSLIPCLLPLMRPDLSALDWAALLPTGYAQVGRHWKFPFLPLGFAGRLIARFLHQSDVRCRAVWASGLLVEWRGQLALFLYNSEEYQLSLTVRMRSTVFGMKAKRNLFVMALEAAESLVSAYSLTGVEKHVPCSHCYSLRNPLTDVFLFRFEECAAALAKGNPLVYCRGIPSRPVRLDSLAPDLSFTNIPLLENVNILQKIGEGGFGVVYRGTLPDGNEVAIKELNVKSAASDRSQVIAEFQQEVFIMASLDHPNIVSLFGIMLNPLKMVMEFVRCGDLYHFLHPGDKEPPNREAFESQRYRMRVACDIAKGMRYLQSITPPVIHRDLRSPNIYLCTYAMESSVVAKVADFGLAQRVAPYVVGYLPTWRWAAPEAFDNTVKQYDERADVYSFGIVLWELVSGKKPFREFEDQYDDFALQKAIISNGLRPTIPESATAAQRQLISRCWDGQPDKRPSFSDIVKLLAAELCISPDEPSDKEGAREVSSRLEHKLNLWRSVHLPNQKHQNVNLKNFEKLPVAGSHVVHAAGSPKKELNRSKSVAPKSIVKDESAQEEKSPASPNANANSNTSAGSQSLNSVRMVKKFMLPDRSGVSAMTLVDPQIWCGSSKGQISVWNANGGEEAHIPNAHTARVSYLLRVTNWVWSASEDNTICVWNLATRVREQTLKQHSAMLRCLVLVPKGSKSGSHNAVWSFDMLGNCCIWNANSYKLEKEPKLGQAAESPACGLVLSSDDNSSQILWLGTRRNILQIDVKTAECVAVWTPDVSVNKMLFANQWLWCATNQPQLLVLNKKGEIVKKIDGHEGKVTQLLHVPQRGLVCSGSFDTSVLVWNERTGVCVSEMRGEHKDVIKSMALLDTGSSLLIWTGGGDVDGSVCIWAI